MSPRMRLPNLGSTQADAINRKSWVSKILPAVSFLCVLAFFGIALVNLNLVKNVRWLETGTTNTIDEFGSKHVPSSPCKLQGECRQAGSEALQGECRPAGSEALPKGIVTHTSDLEMQPLSGFLNIKEVRKSSKSLLTVTVGIKQKHTVDKIVEKFVLSDFVVILFHYDGVLDDWRDLQWCDDVIHIFAANQSKWWFAKRFLHPDIVAEYNYIFIWDEDLDVENFHPRRYLEIVERERLHISQPALDDRKSEVHYLFTARWKKGDVHRRINYLEGGKKCNGAVPPCTGFVEMMAPVFSKAAWRCSWYIIQNDLKYAWGLDYKLGYCAQGDRSNHIGVVDSEYIVHMGLPTLDKISSGAPNFIPDLAELQVPAAMVPTIPRAQLRLQSLHEQKVFEKRWQKAASNDKCWTDPYAEALANSTS